MLKKKGRPQHYSARKNAEMVKETLHFLTSTRHFQLLEKLCAPL